MTDKEFKRLSRSQLIDIIYQFQLKQDELIAENARLTKELEDKRLRITQAGNIAEAALAVNNVMQAAQDAAQQYLDEIRSMHSELDAECVRIRKKAMDEAAMIIAQAEKQAAAMGAQMRKQAEPAKEQTPKLTEIPPVQEEKKEEPAAVPVKKEETAVYETDKYSDEALLEAILSEFGTSSEV